LLHRPYNPASDDSLSASGAKVQGADPDVADLARSHPRGMARMTRTTVDLTQYPDLVVIYLGMRAHSCAAS
jgi:hypothetical protein